MKNPYKDRIASCFSACVSPGIGCKNINAPVCGSDGKTYGNICLLGRAKRCIEPSLSLKHQGKCGSKSGNFYCTSKYVICHKIYSHLNKFISINDFNVL